MDAYDTAQWTGLFGAEVGAQVMSGVFRSVSVHARVSCTGKPGAAAVLDSLVQHRRDQHAAAECTDVYPAAPLGELSKPQRAELVTLDVSCTCDQ